MQKMAERARTGRIISPSEKNSRKSVVQDGELHMNSHGAMRPWRRLANFALASGIVETMSWDEDIGTFKVSLLLIEPNITTSVIKVRLNEIQPQIDPAEENLYWERGRQAVRWRILEKKCHWLHFLLCCLEEASASNPRRAVNNTMLSRRIQVSSKEIQSVLSNHSL